MGSPPALAEFSGKESEVHTENMGKNTSGHKKTHEGSSKEQSLDEDESRSREVTEIELDVAKVGLSVDDLAFDFQDGKIGFMKSELVVEHDAADLPPSSSSNALEEQHPPVEVDVSMDSKLSSSEFESVEEHAMHMEGILQLEQEEVSSSGLDAEIRVNSLVASSFEHMSSNDLNLSENEERQPAVVGEQVLEAHPDGPSSEIKHVEELSLRKEEGLQFKQDQLRSSSSDVMNGDDLLQDADVKLVSSGSSYQHVPFEAKSPFEVEKQLSWADKSIVEPSIKDDDISQEPSVTLEESTAEVNIANNINVPEVLHHETSESALVPPESLEYKSKVDEFDFKDNILDKIVYEDSGHVLEHPDYSAETHGSFVAEENINEDEDEIKEIDEGLLSELDTVGDFSVKEVVGESLHDEQIPGKTSSAIPEYNWLPGGSSVPEIKPELPILEVSSVTDIELAFKQLHEGVDVEEVILPSVIQDQPVVASKLQDVEARSLEDLHVAMKQASEGNIEEMSKLSDSMGGPAGLNEVGSSSSTKELPILEVRTINDIDLAFKQLNEGADVEEVILPSTIEQHLANNESRNPQQSSFDLQVIEARSLEDLHVAMKKASEEHIKDRSKPSDLNKGQAEVNDVGFSSSTKELPVLEVGTVDEIDLPFDQPKNGAEVTSTIEQHLVVNESRDPLHSSSDLQDLDNAMKEVSEVTIEQLPKSSDPIKEISRTSEVNEIGPTKDIESSAVEVYEAGVIQESGSSTVEFGSQETITAVPLNQCIDLMKHLEFHV
ncbi:hypothetical protein GH714_004526 [Hevea brasiliensis]|uniref:Uncharacterized protein n=1 Tax=Hevea brasiliensis TaxID=3981 RepID=A0A6A6KGV3_HEVBR|nr:hypothetical protein GH714_004526 [Hevea brasiliensis]